MTVTVRYFAMLREQSGCERESVSLDPSDANCRGLFDSLSRRYGFQLDQSVVKVAINDEFRDWDQGLADGDTVVFIPPVAGG